MTCLGWKDEGWTASNFTTDQPLFYYFYVRYSGVETEKQILYFDRKKIFSVFCSECINYRNNGI
ncbi:hypothetical protein DPMN_025172 [Dreissena polymorpha]|uniref:Uncharacterized protein n=1 Tax=Dreissena polymorpha TaxID=45954 RepID=A0A9D4LQN0_DREPO|nr:hypothetical protein DPMN_025172 [Dreissena polymorpha]